MAKKKKINTVDLNRFSAKSVSKESKLIRVKVLIVCEGEKTEPNYFRQLKHVNLGLVVHGAMKPLNFGMYCTLTAVAQQ